MTKAEIKAAVAAHVARMWRIEALPKPLDWPDAGSLQYHVEAIRHLDRMEDELDKAQLP